jgi:hypothetical protein
LSNPIDAQGVESLVSVLQHNLTLIDLDLRCIRISDQLARDVPILIKTSREGMRHDHHILSDLIGDEQSLISTLPYDMSIINEIIQLADQSIPDCHVDF